MARSVGHLRKRSRDVRVGEIPTESRRPLLGETPVREESENAENNFETSNTHKSTQERSEQDIVDDRDSVANGVRAYSTIPGYNEPAQSISETVKGDHVTKTGKSSANQETRDSASSPTKKRSRDKDC